MTDNATILVVEDEADLRAGICHNLEVEGFKVLSASNGREGLDQIAAHSPDLVLLDLSMPRLNGWDLLQLLKAGAVTATIPVVACTAHAMGGDRERALAAGFDAYLAKPYRPAELIECVEAFLGPGESGGEDDGWGGSDWSLT